ncbi:MAG TPA: hypothetical protein VFP34_19550 [Microlunatus sp.]|nr:hypothetical protein [Microlunatus sp.]
MGGPEIRPAGRDELRTLAALFGAARATRHCWCTAFCTTSWQFATGWYGGGNRRRFEALAAASPAPMGVLAFEGDDPTGWCACGPRSRYAAALAGRSRLLASRPRDEDDDVWLIACLVVRPDRTGTGLVMPLLRGAVATAREGGATAIEAWPLARGVRRPGTEHVGREALFARLGFRRVDQPAPDRVLMRLELSGSRAPSPDAGPG